MFTFIYYLNVNTYYFVTLSLWLPPSIEQDLHIYPNFFQNPQLATAFLQLSLSVARLKLLNLKYNNTKLDVSVPATSEVFDMSMILPCLNSVQWIALASKIVEDEEVLLLVSFFTLLVSISIWGLCL